MPSIAMIDFSAGSAFSRSTRLCVKYWMKSSGVSKIAGEIHIGRQIAQNGRVILRRIQDEDVRP
jgi:hypothetical protein